MISLFKWKLDDNLSLELINSVESEHVSVLLNAILNGDTWEDLVSIVGTVFGLILVCRPSKGPTILRTYSGHTGMIFGLLLIDNLLYSISDDRSLRVWQFSTNYSETSCSEIACEYGHSARPFAITHGNNFIFTAGIDEVVLKWKFVEGTLQIADRIYLNLGCIRNLIFHKSSLFCCGENGGLTVFDPTLEYPTIKELETCSGLRNFARDGDNLYTVGAKGSLFLNGSPIYTDYNLRFLTSSQCQKTIIAYGENIAIILGKSSSTDSKSSEHSKDQLIQTDARIISCVCSPDYVFCYTIDKKGILFDTKTSSKWKITFDETLKKISKTTQLVPFSLETIAFENRIYVTVGSGCGHLILFEIEPSDSQLVEGHTYSMINRHFKSEIILSIKQFEESLLCLVKNVGMVVFKLDRSQTPFILWVNTRSISNVVDIDAPCGFLSYKSELFISGFHSTDFHIVNKDGLSVYNVNCGGANRPWSCYFKNDELIFEFIKREKLYSFSQGLVNFQVYQENVHGSQIIFIKRLISDEDHLLICTASNDTSMVFSFINKNNGEWRICRRILDPAGFQCIDSYNDEGNIILATGCGKGRILLWKLEANEFENSDELGLYKLGEYSNSEDLRILSIEFCSKDLLTAVFADGTIRMFLFDKSKFVEIATIEPPDLSLFVKIAWIKESHNMVAISTSGKLFMWSFCENSFNLIAKIEVAKWGLSALTVGPKSQIVIGSESGDIFIFNYKDGALQKDSTISYHSCTVTNVKFEKNSLFSIALDCRLAKYDISENGLILDSSKSLPIWDPSDFIVERSMVITVGSGISSIRY